MLERTLKWSSSIVIGHYRLIACLFALLTAVSIYVVAHMEVKTDIIDVLPSGNPTVAKFRDFMQKYDPLGTVTVIVSSDRDNIEEYADLIETLAEKLRRSPLVEQVDYFAFGRKNDFFIRNFPVFLDDAGLRQLSKRLSSSGISRQIGLDYLRIASPVGSPPDYELMERDPLDIRGIISSGMKRAHPDNPLDLSMGYYITRDHRSCLLFVKPAGKSRDVAFVKRFKPEMDAVIKSALAEKGDPRGVSVQITGGHILSEEVRQVIRHDIISSVVISVILIGLIIRLAYRVRAAVLAIVACTTMSSLSLTLASAYLIYGSLNIVTSIVCGLLIGMYVDYCILTLKRYGDEFLLGNDRMKAIETTMVKAGSSMVISAVTTSLSFFSIVLTRFDGLHELGIVSGIGVLICFFVTLFFMSSLLVWAGERGPGSLLGLKAPASGVEAIVSLTQRHARGVVYAGIAVITVLAVGMAYIRFDNNPDHIGIRDSRAVAAMKALNAKMGNSGEPLIVVIKAGGPDGLAELNAQFDKLEDRLAQWKKEGLIYRADSLSSFLPPPSAQARSIRAIDEIFRPKSLDAGRLKRLVGKGLEDRGLSYDRGYLDTYLSSIVSALKGRSVVGLAGLQGIGDMRLRRFFNRQDMSIAAYLYPAGGGWGKGVIETLKSEVGREGPQWSLLGSPILYAEIKTAILRGSCMAAVFTLVMNFFVIFFFLRKIRYVIFAMLPVCLGFLLTMAVMGWLGASFNFINVGTLALIFGFGVDYGIYVMQAYLREDRRDVGHAIRLSGKNVMMCAATTVAGCGSLITARFAGVASIGLVLTIGAACCSAVTLILLPAILRLGQGAGLP